MCIHIKDIFARSEAIEVGNQLSKNQFIVHVVDEKKSFFDGNYFYKLTLNGENAIKHVSQSKRNSNSASFLGFLTGSEKSASLDDTTLVEKQEFANCRRRTLRSGVHNASELPTSEDGIRVLLSQIARSVDIRDRSYRLKSYPSCFLAPDAVNFLCSKFLVSRTDACQFLTGLMKKGYIYHSAKKLQTFEDRTLFYSISDSILRVTRSSSSSPNTSS